MWNWSRKPHGIARIFSGGARCTFYSNCWWPFLQLTPVNYAKKFSRHWGCIPWLRRWNTAWFLIQNLTKTVCWPGFVRTRRELTGLSEIWIAENPRTGKADNGKEWRKGQRIRRKKEKGKRGERGMERDKVPYRDFFSISSPADICLVYRRTPFFQLDMKEKPGNIYSVNLVTRRWYRIYAKFIFEGD